MSIVEVLMERDDMSRDEAEEFVAYGRQQVLTHGCDPEEILYDEFGLEPDYIFDLLGC